MNWIYGGFWIGPMILHFCFHEITGMLITFWGDNLYMMTTITLLNLISGSRTYDLCDIATASTVCFKLLPPISFSNSFGSQIWAASYRTRLDASRPLKNLEGFLSLWQRESGLEFQAERGLKTALVSDDCPQGLSPPSHKPTTAPCSKSDEYGQHIYKDNF